MEAAGCVFLPAAGYREGSTVYDDSKGYYWSSTCGSNDHKADHVKFDSSNLDADTGCERFYGYSVRLVREVE